MKKLLFAFTSFALATSAYAQEGADIKWNAEMRVRFTNQENTPIEKTSNDNFTKQRTKIGATFTKGEDLAATVTLLNAATWGNSGNISTTGGNVAADGDDGKLYVHEAFAFWKAMDNLALKVGRSTLEVGDGSVISSNNWEQVPLSSESLSASYFTEWVNISAVAVRAMNDGPSANYDDGVTAVDTTVDIEYYGAMIDVKNLPEFLKMVNFHALQSKATGLLTAVVPGGVKDSKTRYGLTVKGDTAGIDYRASYAMYDGEQEGTAAGKVDHKASMLDAEVGYTLPAIMNLRISALYHMDSGDDDPAATSDKETYDPFFNEKHNNAGMADIIGWGNSTYIKVGVALEPVEMTKVGLDYYMFTKTEKEDAIYGQAAYGSGGLGTAYTGTAAINDDDVGNEFDLWATHALSNGAELNARVSMFQAGDAFGSTKEDVTQFELGATFKF